MNTAEMVRAGGLFVTGTDTGVGKSLVAAALVHLLTQCGFRIGVTKPFESGVADPSGLGEDGRLLQWAAESPESVDHISPCRLHEPVAPALAARREGVAIDWPQMLKTIRSARTDEDFRIAEGAGGLLVPLHGTQLVADLAGELGWPLLIVARAGLGTINHTLLTLECAASRNLPVAGWIISGLPSEAGTAERYAAAEIARLTDIPCWGVLPVVGGTSEEKVAVLAGEMQDWPRVTDLVQYLKDSAERSVKSVEQQPKPES